MSMNEVEKFNREKESSIEKMSGDVNFSNLSKRWFDASCNHKYSYNYSWMGRPIIQYPQDIIAMQEIIWQTKPDLIIETGVAHGGSLIFYSSLLEMLGNGGRVVGVDIDIREHNRLEIKAHPMYKNINLVEGSSVDSGVFEKVQGFANEASSIMVILDSNHTHSHVLSELFLYSPLVTYDNYLVVFDTVIEDMKEEAFPDRPWGRGNNPKTAVHEFINGTDCFEIDRQIQDKLQITVAPDGYLKRIK